MSECEFAGMEHLAGNGDMVGLAEEGVLAFTVEQVASHGVAKVLEVNADLMGAASVQRDFDERGALQMFKGSVSRAGGAAAADGHAFTVGLMALDGGVNLALGGGELPADDGFVDFFDFTPGELSGESQVGGVVFGDDEATAGFFVEPMDNSGPRDPANATKAARAMMEQRIDQGVFGVARRRMDDQPGRFVQGQEVVIFVEDFQRNVFRLGYGGLGLRPVDSDDFAGAGTVGGFGVAPVDLNMTLMEESLDGAARNAGKLRGQVGVEAL